MTCLIYQNKRLSHSDILIFLMHDSDLFSMSCSHSLTTDQPSALSFLVTDLSRFMLHSILSRQNFFGGFFSCRTGIRARSRRRRRRESFSPPQSRDFRKLSETSCSEGCFYAGAAPSFFQSSCPWSVFWTSPSCALPE